MHVRVIGYVRIKRANILYFRTKTNLIDPPLRNLGNFHVDKSNDVTTLYWIALEQITITQKDKIKIQYEFPQGIEMSVI